MSQKAFLASLDAQLHAGLAVAGLADAGTYTPASGGLSVCCSVYVDRSVQDIGELNQISASRCEVTYVLGSMSPQLPSDDGILVVDGDTLVNVHELTNDGSLSRWLVRRG